MGKIKWTDAQKSIIEKRNCNLLVSAGAGSGKTTVMIERIANLILDKEKPTPISRFLIISFTKFYNTTYFSISAQSICTIMSEIIANKI